MAGKVMDVAGLLKFMRSSKGFDRVLQKIYSDNLDQKTSNSQSDRISDLSYLSLAENVSKKKTTKVNILSLGDGKCSAELRVDDEHTNPMGGLHGGLSATLVDLISSYALSTKAPLPHVSVDMHMSYLKGAVKGDDILIEANVLKFGKTMAFLEVDIKNKATGDLLVKGSHTKFILQ